MATEQESDADPHEQNRLDDIAEYGWSGVIIDADEQGPGFEYTVGLMKTADHPEVIVFGLPGEVSHDLLWEIVRGIQNGVRFEVPGRYEHVLEGRWCECREVHPSRHAEFLGYAMWHRRAVERGGSLRAVQCVWPDERGRFPGEEGCQPSVIAGQPDLSEIMAE